MTSVARTLDQLAPLSAAETQVVGACVAGEVAILGAHPPDAPSEAVHLRASVVRIMAQGGDADHPTHERGVQIEGGWIDGTLDLAHCTGVRAISLHKCTVPGGLDLDAARLGNLSLDGSRIRNLYAQGAHFGGSIYLGNGFVAEQGVFISIAQVDGQINCRGGQFNASEHWALNLQGTTVRGDVFLGEGFSATGEVRLTSARLNGQFDCSGGRFDNPDGLALHAEGVRISSATFLSHGFEATGRVSLADAQIDSQVTLTGGAFLNPGGEALSAQGITIGQDLFMKKGFRSEGVVSFSGARIDGSFVASGAVLDNTQGDALVAHHMEVSASVYFNEEFSATGAVDLTGGRVSGDMDCTRATFSSEHGAAFSARSLRVAQTFYWRKVTVSDGAILLTQAFVGGLADDFESWPEGGRLMMDGFVYDRFVYGDASASKRLNWLEKHVSTDFQPQPYQQLAKIVGEMGHRFDRGRVLIAMERRLRAQNRKDMSASRHWRVRRWSPFKGIWDHLLEALVGYGYRPFRAFFWGIGLILLAWAGSWYVWHAGDFAPALGPILASAGWQEIATSGDANAAATWSAIGAAGQDYETFRPWIYAVDVVVPLVNLGQDAAWAPSTSRGFAGVVWHHMEWIVRLAGWVIAALSAGAVAGVIRHD